MSLIAKLKSLSHKNKVLIILGSFSLVCLIYISTLPSRNPLPSQTPSSTSISSAPAQPGLAITPYPTRYFLRNTVIPTLHKLVSVHWSSAAPFYLSQNNVYGFFNSTSLFTFPTNFRPAFIPHSPYLLGTFENQLIAFNPLTKESLTKPLAPSSFYSPSLRMVAILSGSKVDVYQDRKLVLSFPLSVTPTSAAWSASETFLLALSQQSLTMIGLPTETVQPIALTQLPIQVEFSPSDKFFAVLTTENVYIYNTSNLQSIQTYPLAESVSQAVFSWSPQDQLFLVERRTKPRVVDYVYLLSPLSPTKAFISESLGIPTRLNLDIHPVSPSSDNLMVVDNSGRPWIISTVPQDPNQGRGGDHHREDE